MKRQNQTSRTPVPSLRPLTIDELAPVRGGAYEFYMQIVGTKQGSDK